MEEKDVRVFLVEKIKPTIQAMLEQLRVFKHYKRFSLYCIIYARASPECPFSPTPTNSYSKLFHPD